MTDKYIGLSKLNTYARNLYGFISIYARSRRAVAGLIFFITLGAIGLFAPAVAPYGPFEFTGVLFAPPSSQFPMGTDDLGRDVLSAVIFGSRASLTVGVLAALISAVVGTVIGSIAGFLGGKVDSSLMGLTEVFQVLPTFVLALAILALFGPSFLNVIVAIAIVSWPSNARLVRGQVLSVKEEQFVIAARALGMGSLKIVFSEILPNVIPTVIVNTMLQVGSAITAEAGLGFLGLSDPRIMSWGLMIRDARPFLLTAWWMMTFPGLCILVTILALYFVADGLNLALNPERGKYQR